MNKRKAIQIMANAASLYNRNLNDQKVLFLYGSASEIKKQIRIGDCYDLPLKCYEVAFHRYNFLHLTGAKTNHFNVSSAVYFYEKCLNHRLTESDFYFAKDGSTEQKLSILERMMNIKQNATMIGNFTDHGVKLFTEKAVGNICCYFQRLQRRKIFHTGKSRFRYRYKKIFFLRRNRENDSPGKIIAFTNFVNVKFCP
ncbi:MAG: hypothetical protein HDR18_14070 [Lachnospiraceae bacterium]|nr:hypothetical protein [Lachnospiraceae bacterium]